jgi:Flp pilus assembly protein TadB
MVFIVYIALAFLGALGVYFLFTAFTGSLDRLFRKPIEVMPGELQEKERQIPLFAMLSATASDLSRLLSRGPEDLPDRLRRSGFFYPSIEVFYVRRILFAIFWGVTIFVVLSVVQLGLIPTIFAASGAAVFGFFEPDRRLSTAINARIKRMSKEMGYSIDLIVMSESVKADIQESLRSVSDFGLFGQFCNEVYTYMDSGGMLLMPAVMKAESNYPKFPNLSEFVDLLQMKSSGVPIDQALRVKAESLRNDLAMEIIRVASSTESRIALLTSTGGAMAALLPILVAMIFIAF